MKINYIIFLLGSFLIIFGSNFFFSNTEAEKVKQNNSSQESSEFNLSEDTYEISDNKIEQFEAKNKSECDSYVRTESIKNGMEIRKSYEIKQAELKNV